MRFFLALFLALLLPGAAFASETTTPCHEFVGVFYSKDQRSPAEILAAANTGDAQAQYEIGMMYYTGSGVSQSFTEGLNWLLKAANQEYKSAFSGVGGIYWDGGCGVKQDYAQSAKWYRKSAENGDAEAQYRIGMLYELGWGVKVDDAEAVKWLRKAAVQGHAEAKEEMEFVYKGGDRIIGPRPIGLPQQKALHTEDPLAEIRQPKLTRMAPHDLNVLQESASHGDCQDQATLGAMYAYGSGVKQDYAEAFKWFRKSADQGNGLAQDELGSMYSHGHGVEQDYAEAYFWFGLGQKSGNMIRSNTKIDTPERANAKRHLSPEQITVVESRIAAWRPKPCTEVVNWFRQLAEKGNALAQEQLADRYESGEGVKRDYAEAAKWYRKAAEQGEADAQRMLGQIYSSGKGVKQDYAEAYFWSLIGAEITPGTDYQAQHLAPEKKAAVEMRVKEWKQTHPGPLSSKQLDWTVPNSP